MSRRPAHIRLGRGGPRMRLEPKLMTSGSTSLFMKRELYEPELLLAASIVRSGDVVLDIGASFGVFSLVLAAAAGPGEVHSFEPGEESSRRLRHNAALNPQLNITVNTLALSDHRGTATLHAIAGALTTYSLGDDGVSRGEAVEVCTLDAWARERDLSKLAFIKIDVEGHEPAVLRGGLETLRQHQPIILFENSASALERNGYEIDSTVELLADLGYTFFDGSSGALAPSETLDDGNYVAATADRAERLAPLTNR